MNIKQQITVGAMALSLIPLMFVGLLISTISQNTGKTIVEDTIKNNLISIQE